MGEKFTRPDKNTRMLAFGAMLYLRRELAPEGEDWTNRKRDWCKAIDTYMGWKHGHTSALHTSGRMTVEKADALLKAASDAGGKAEDFMMLVREYPYLPKLVRRPSPSQVKTFVRLRAARDGQRDLFTHPEKALEKPEDPRRTRIVEAEPDDEPEQEPETPSEGRPVGPLEYVYDSLDMAADTARLLLRRLEEVDRITADSNPLMNASLGGLITKAVEIDRMLAPYSRTR